MGNRIRFRCRHFIQDTSRLLQSGWGSDVSCVPLSPATPTYGVSRTRTPSVRSENSCSGIGLDTTVIFLCPKKSTLGAGGPFCIARVCPEVSREQNGIRVEAVASQECAKNQSGKLWPPTIAVFVLHIIGWWCVHFRFSVPVAGYMTSSHPPQLGLVS